ncbi:hypothetical protein Bca52824_089676 [Brassica carinata]|uniref:Uncharacterized protein n=1 Tax=Brassica carinata TaxID=52824 RepID=A0A8X7PFM1_BRACI|nr:hypothetical protein Bca52824_089676 [Brassica carinata]
MRCINESSDDEDPILNEEYAFRESNEFDDPVHSTDLHKFENSETGYFRDLANIYARFGLHSYNSRKGTNFQLSRVDKYINYGVFSYSLTFEATDPQASCKIQTFLKAIGLNCMPILPCTCEGSLHVPTFESREVKGKAQGGNAIFYFSFKNLNAPPHGLCQDHRVIIRRTTDGLQDSLS